MEFLQQYGSDSDSDTSCGPLPPAAEAAEAAEPPPPTQPTTKKQRIRGKKTGLWRHLEVSGGRSAAEPNTIADNSSEAVLQKHAIDNGCFQFKRNGDKLSAKES
jgi:hypothetical protein